MNDSPANLDDEASAAAPEQRPAKKTRSRRSIIVRAVVQVGFMVALVAIALPHFDFAQVRESLLEVGVGTAAAYIVIMFSTRCVNAWRWWLISRRDLSFTKVSYGFLLRTIMFTEFVNVWFPSFLGGDVVKVWKVGRREGKPKEAALSVLLDRLTGMVALATVCSPFLLVFVHRITLEQVSADKWYLLAALVGGGALSVVLLLQLKMTRRWLERALHFFRERKFLVVPTSVGFLSAPAIVLAHYVVLADHPNADLLSVATIALLARLGRVVPLSAIGVTAVEGTLVFLGTLLGYPSALMFVLAGLNLTTKYLVSTAGLTIEIGFGGVSTMKALVGGKDE